jgi:hypothetical protein
MIISIRDYVERCYIYADGDITRNLILGKL